MLGLRGVLQSKSLAVVLLRTMSSAAAGQKVAVVLSGCGVYDGTEVHEAAAALAALSRHGVVPTMYAPDKKQAHVVDHTAGTEMDQERNVLKESARIARGAVAPLSDLKAADFSAVVFPGGFGAAKKFIRFRIQGCRYGS